MKTKKPAVCPGCHKHCEEGHARCKYGCRYFAKLHAQENTACACPKKNCKHKWENDVTQGSSIWHLLSCSRRIKKALRSKSMTEEQLLSALNDSERQTLSGLLNKLESFASES